MSLNVNGNLVDKLQWRGEQNLYDNINKFDFVFLSETWTNVNSCVDLDGYVVYRKERVRRARATRDSGGLVCYIKEFLAKGVQEINWENENGMCLKFDKNVFGWKEDIYFVCVYMTDNKSTREDLNNGMNCYDLLLEQVANVSDLGACIVMGDFNARCGSERDECLILNDDEDDEFDFEDDLLFENVFRKSDIIKKNMSLIRISEDLHVNDYGRKLIELTHACDLIFLSRMGYGNGKVTFCGHQGQSVNDYVMCCKKALINVSNFKVHDVNIFSDHCILSFSVETGVGEEQGVLENTQEVGRKGEVKYIKWANNKENEYIMKMGSDDIEEKVNNTKNALERNVNTAVLEECVNKLGDIILEAGSDHIRTVNTGGRAAGGGAQQNRGQGWYDEQLAQQAKRFGEGERWFHETKTQESRVYMCEQRSIYRRMCRDKKRTHNRAEGERLALLSKTNSKQFWKEIKGGNNKRDLPNLDFFQHFKTLAGHETILSDEAIGEIERREQNEETNYIDQLDSPFTLLELEENIKELKSDKAAGSDMIINEFIKKSSLSVKLLILSIFNYILILEYFPENWSTGLVSPVFKQGDKQDLNNYRGISVQSCLGKLFTRIMNKRLTKWADENNLLFEGQYGFRKGRGTVDCLFILNSLIEMLFARGKKLYVLFIDYEKAYDYISRAALWLKLFNTGVSSKCIRIYKNMYSKMKLSIKTDQDRGTFSSTCGLLQGESTSPLMFSFYVNDLVNSFGDTLIGTSVQDIMIKLILFADDMALFSETREGLQRGINNLQEYCLKWGLKVNTRKTKIVVFRKGGQLGQNDIWHYGGENIEVVPFFKYLGCYFSSGGSFNKCVTELINSARRALFSLKKCFSRNQELLTSMKIGMFDSMVSPILFYCCEIWGSRRADLIDTFHRSFLKCLLNVRSSTPNCFVYGELGVFPLYIERQVRVISYWAKLLTLKNTNPNAFTVKIYNELFELSITHPDKITWATSVRDLLYKNGFGEYWLAQRVGSVDSFVPMFRLRLRDIFLQEWRNEVAQTSIGRLFQFIKTDFVFEPYLDMLKKAPRIALSRIRLSSHIFNIERGRWARNRRNRGDRVCSLCNVLECEFHCLVQCPRYVLQRVDRLPEGLKNRPCMYEFLKFLKSKREVDINRLAALCLAVQIEHRKYV